MDNIAECHAYCTHEDQVSDTYRLPTLTAAIYIDAYDALQRILILYHIHVFIC